MAFEYLYLKNNTKKALTSSPPVHVIRQSGAHSSVMISDDERHSRYNHFIEDVRMCADAGVCGRCLLLPIQWPFGRASGFCLQSAFVYSYGCGRMVCSLDLRYGTAASTHLLLVLLIRLQYRTVL